jgi:prepilin-type N-terminal cleavage/methylation domain-containing protein
MTAAKSAGRGKVLADRGTRSGFTIIEVVLVLAIAGLIFLMVFIALPVLQRSQRDTERRSAVGRVASQIQQYQTNNNGRLPKNGSIAAQEPTGDDDRVKIEVYNSSNNPAASFIKNYMNGATAEYNEFMDPSGWAYGLKIDEFAGDQPTLNFDEHMIYMYKGARCNGELLEKTNNSRDYALLYKLEGASVYCTNNS